MPNGFQPFSSPSKKTTWTKPRSCMSSESSNDQSCREMQKHSGNAHSCGDFKIILSGLSLSGSLGGCWAHHSCTWAEAGSTPRWGANSSQGLVWALGFWEAYSGVPQQCCEGVCPPPATRTLYTVVFVCAGVGTDNPPLHSPAPNRMSNHHPWLWGTKVKKNIDLTPKLLRVFISCGE